MLEKSLFLITRITEESMDIFWIANISSLSSLLPSTTTCPFPLLLFSCPAPLSNPLSSPFSYPVPVPLLSCPFPLLPLISCLLFCPAPISCPSFHIPLSCPLIPALFSYNPILSCLLSSLAPLLSRPLTSPVLSSSAPSQCGKYIHMYIKGNTPSIFVCELQLFVQEEHSCIFPTCSPHISVIHQTLCYSVITSGLFAACSYSFIGNVFFYVNKC